MKITARSRRAKVIVMAHATAGKRSRDEKEVDDGGFTESAGPDGESRREESLHEQMPFDERWSLNRRRVPGLQREEEDKKIRS
jgi:hypothetical protein